MTMILGVLTALTVAVWGMIWYLEGERRGHLSTNEMKARLRPPARMTLPAEELEALMVPSLLDDVEDETLAWARAPSPEGRPDSEALPTFVRPAAPAGPDRGMETAPMSVRALTGEQQELMGYCARCRAKRFLVDPERTTTRQGRPAIRGRCMICDADMLVFTFET